MYVLCQPASEISHNTFACSIVSSHGKYSFVCAHDLNLNIIQTDYSELIFTAIRLVYSRFGEVRHRVNGIELIHIPFSLCREILAVLWYVRRTEKYMPTVFTNVASYRDWIDRTMAAY